MNRLLTACLLMSLMTGPAFAQASASVSAGPLSGHAQAGPLDRRDDAAPPDRQVARGPRTDDTRNCNTRGVTVRSGNGSSSASASVSTSSGGSTAVAGGGSPGSHTEYFGCDAPTNR